MTDETYPADGVYRLESGLTPGQDNIYTVRVFLGADLLTVCCRYDREDAIDDATDFVAWHRADKPVEVIEL